MSKKISNKKIVEGDITTYVVAVFALIQKGDKYLIAKRSSDDPQAGGMWSVPGGKVDLDEGREVLEKNLQREVKEEVGIEIEDEVTLIGNGGFTQVSGHHVVGLTFLCKWKGGAAKPLEDQEEVRWMTLPEILEFNELPLYTREKFELLDAYLRSKRHTVTPRVLCLVFNRNRILFLKASRAKDWIGYYEPPGGHIEKGEDPIAAGKRELFEETGLKVEDMKLVGVVHVNGFFGKDVMMFIVKAETNQTEVKKSEEGIPVWLDTNKIDNYRLIEDMKPIVSKVIKMQKGEIFIGVSEFDGRDKLLSFDIKIN